MVSDTGGSAVLALALVGLLATGGRGGWACRRPRRAQPGARPADPATPAARVTAKPTPPWSPAGKAGAAPPHRADHLPMAPPRPVLNGPAAPVAAPPAPPQPRAPLHAGPAITDAPDPAVQRAPSAATAESCPRPAGPHPELEGYQRRPSAWHCTPPNVTGAVGPTLTSRPNTGYRTLEGRAWRERPVQFPLLQSELWPRAPAQVACRNDGDPAVLFTTNSPTAGSSPTSLTTPAIACIAVRLPMVSGRLVSPRHHADDPYYYGEPHFALRPDGYYMSATLYQPTAGGVSLLQRPRRCRLPACRAAGQRA